jgi:protoporphyrinogen IX oxidase
MNFFRHEAIGKHQSPVEVLEIAKRKGPIAILVVRYQLLQCVGDHKSILPPLQAELDVSLHTSVMLHELHQHQVDMVLALLLTLTQLEFLDTEPAAAIVRRKDAPVKAYGVTLFLDLLLQAGKAYFNLLVRLAIDCPMRFEELHFLLQCHYLPIKFFNTLLVGVPCGHGLDEVVVRLDPSQLEQQPGRCQNGAGESHAQSPIARDALRFLALSVRHRFLSLALWNSSCYAALSANRSAADHGFAGASGTLSTAFAISLRKNIVRPGRQHKKYWVTRMQSTAYYLWFKALHIAFMVTWFAGLFYLPRLFIYHAEADDVPGRSRFSLMEKRLYGIMTIGATLTALFGLALLWMNPALLARGWFQAKLLLLVAMIVYHFWCRHWIRRLETTSATQNTTGLRWFNEMPVIFLLGIVFLAVLKPA